MKQLSLLLTLGAVFGQAAFAQTPSSTTPAATPPAHMAPANRPPPPPPLTKEENAEVNTAYAAALKANPDLATQAQDLKDQQKALQDKQKALADKQKAYQQKLNAALQEAAPISRALSRRIQLFIRTCRRRPSRPPQRRRSHSESTETREHEAVREIDDQRRADQPERAREQLSPFYIETKRAGGYSPRVFLVRHGRTMDLSKGAMPVSWMASEPAFVAASFPSGRLCFYSRRAHHRSGFGPR